MIKYFGVANLILIIQLINPNLSEPALRSKVVERIRNIKLRSKLIFSSNLPVLATIGLKLNHPLKKHLLNLPSIKVLTQNKQNSQLIFEKVISFIT